MTRQPATTTTLWNPIDARASGDARAASTVECGCRRHRAGLSDVITVDAMTLANPDPVTSSEVRRAAQPPDPGTFSGSDERGYIDYPLLPATVSSPAKAA